jgi:hypothetical protein
MESFGCNQGMFNIIHLGIIRGSQMPNEKILKSDLRSGLAVGKESSSISDVGWFLSTQC